MQETAGAGVFSTEVSSMHQQAALRQQTRGAPRQRQRLAEHEVHVGAKPAEDAGKLDRDVPGAHDHDAVARHVLQHQRLVRRDRVLLRGNRSVS